VRVRVRVRSCRVVRRMCTHPRRGGPWHE
jgi:hypothetical protein